MRVLLKYDRLIFIWNCIGFDASISVEHFVVLLIHWRNDNIFPILNVHTKVCLCLFRPLQEIIFGAYIPFCLIYMHRDFTILCSPIQSIARFVFYIFCLDIRIECDITRHDIGEFWVVIVFHFDFNGAALRVLPSEFTS